MYGCVSARFCADPRCTDVVETTGGIVFHADTVARFCVDIGDTDVVRQEPGGRGEREHSEKHSEKDNR